MLVSRFEDDAFYYFGIARHLAAGEGFTFDGIHRTNGFHPLWQLMLVPLFSTSSDIAPLRVVGLLELALLIATAVLLLRTLGPRYGRHAARCGAALLLFHPLASRVFLSGMETSLFVLLTVLAWRRYLAIEARVQAGVSAWMLLGVVCALAFLARLEGALVALSIVVLAWRRLRSAWRLPMAFLAPQALVASAYFAWNHVSFHTLLPVSGATKALFASRLPLALRLGALLDVPWPGQHLVYQLFELDDSIFQAPGVAIALYFGLLAGAVGLVVWYRRAIRLGDLSLPFLAAALVIVADRLTTFWIGAWQHGLWLLITAAAGAAVIGRARKWAIAATLAAALLVAGCARATWWPPALEGHWGMISMQAARWAQANIPEDDVAASWNAGMIGYLSHRHVVNLDGLANDAVYLAEVQPARRILGYLTKSGVRWIIDYGCTAYPGSGPLSGFEDYPELARRARWMTGFTVDGPAATCDGLLMSIWRVAPP